MACLVACTNFLSQATFCQKISHWDIITEVPTIGKDPEIDNCYCKQSMIAPMHDCAVCQFRNNIVSTDRTQDYIQGCNRSYPDRKLGLANGAGSSLKPPSVTKSAGFLIVMLAVSVVSGSIVV